MPATPVDDCDSLTNIPLYNCTGRLDRLLAHYIPPWHIPDFRRLQASHGFLISGSTALQFFDNSSYSEADLDIYTDYGCAWTIARWLEDVGSVVLDTSGNDLQIPEATPDFILAANRPGIDTQIEHAQDPHTTVSGDDIRSQSEYTDCGAIQHVLNFRSYLETKIQLIVVDSSPLDAILSFHSTVVMNIIGAHNAYALYPRETFTERLSLAICNGTDKQEAARAKYELRGWAQLRNHMDVNALRLGVFEPGKRRVGDSQCWTVKLPPIDGVTAPLIDPLTQDSWELTYGGGLSMEPRLLLDVSI